MAIISPRSTNYERLEGGMGPSRTGRKGRFAWKKVAIGAVIVVGIVWVFGPRVRKQLSWSGKESSDVSKTHNTPPPPKTTENGVRPPVVPPVHDDGDKAPQPRPTSFDTDPDPSKTVYCSVPFQESSPLVQYALMIDAGSTGSRIHVYKFNNCARSPTYEYETFRMTRPGLSDFLGKPLEAAKSLDVLMDEAVRIVPEALRKCTPLAVKATAGLRLLGSAESAAILEAVQDRLTHQYPFLLQDVVIMDGKDEGVYAWITANYLLNTIRSDSPSDTHSHAVLELGGASTQIVFEPTFSTLDSSLEDGDHKYDLTFGGKKHVLYQHSHLGYGLMHARKSVHRLVDFMASLRKDTSGDDEVISNPCLAEGTRRVVEIEDERTGDKRNVTMGGEDIGSFEACNRVIELLLAKDAICKLKPCSFNGVYQPSLLDTFPTGNVLLLSYFYDRLHPLLLKLDPQPITVSSIGGLAQEVCRGKSSWIRRWGDDKKVMEELEGRPEWCLDLTFMHGLLRLGYEVGERELGIGKQIGGTELGWALGATIVMVGGELKCRI